MKAIFKDINIAAWSCGMSKEQMEAIFSLSGFLIDDFEQGTSFRVKKTLYKLGLNPMISDKKINQMIQLSRGNELAFLFFILEGYYKVLESPCAKKQKKVYTSNEKLIMTAIKELDLMMTLRELDRILPPPSQPKVPEELNDDKKCVIEKDVEPSPEKKVKKVSKSPYFQRQPRPKERKQMDVIFKAQEFSVVDFDFWKAGEAPKYNVTNEDRWFSEYKFNPALRVVKDCLNIAIETLFKELDLIELNRLEKEKTSMVEGDVPEEQMPEAEPQQQKSPNLCEHHKLWAQQIAIEKDKIIVEAKERCLQVIDTTLRHRTIRRARIIEQLDNDMNQLACKYENLSYATVKVLKGEECEVCEKLVFVPGAHPKAPKMLSGKECISHPITTNRFKTLRLRGGGVKIDLMPDSDLSVGNECVKLLAQYQNELKEKKVRHRRDGCPPQSATNRKIKFSCKSSKSNLVRCQEDKKPVKTCFFKSTMDHKPYIFNYKRIFTIIDGHVDYQNVIEKSAIKALKDPMRSAEKAPLSNKKELSSCTSGNSLSMSCTSNPIFCRIREHKTKIVDLIHDYVQMVFQEHKLARERKEALEIAELGDDVIRPLKYEEINYFDPNDSKLMDRLLKDGMQMLCKDPRFVLASLPDSHKLRVLQEWVKRRYGKVYSKLEEEEELNFSQAILKNVMESIQGPPLLDGMGINTGTTSYGERDETFVLAKKIRQNYYNLLNEDILGQIGYCYLAVESFFPKSTFFAYLPAHSNVITRHNPWNSLDFRDYRLLRQQRKK